MSKKKYKAWVITAIIVVMFLTILALLYLLRAKAVFFGIGGILAAVGIGCGTRMLHNWLAGLDEDELDPVEIREDHESEAAPAADVPIDVYTYDQIREELGGGKD